MQQLLLLSAGSRAHGLSHHGSRVLEHRLSSCGPRAQLFLGVWDLPGPGIEPVSPALVGPPEQLLCCCVPDIILPLSEALVSLVLNVFKKIEIKICML